MIYSNYHFFVVNNFMIHVAILWKFFWRKKFSFQSFQSLHSSFLQLQTSILKNILWDLIVLLSVKSQSSLLWCSHKRQFVCIIIKNKNIIIKFGSQPFSFKRFVLKRISKSKVNIKASLSSIYLRYVDDILAVFDNKQDLLNLLKFLNNRHPKIYGRKTN